MSVIVKKVLVCKTVNLLIYSILTFLLAQEKLTMKDRFLNMVSAFNIKHLNMSNSLQLPKLREKWWQKMVFSA